jgi:hypothetical protein
VTILFSIANVPVIEIVRVINGRRNIPDILDEL